MAAADRGITGPKPRERTDTALARPAGNLPRQLAGADGRRGHLPPDGGLSLLAAAPGSSPSSWYLLIVIPELPWDSGLHKPKAVCERDRGAGNLC